MTGNQSRLSIYILFGIGLFLILLGFSASNGFFNLDEFIYFIGAQTLRDTGGFSISNGFEKFGSDDLRLWLLVSGSSGLVPQYPVGTSLAGASLLGVFGQKSLITLNVLAGIGTLGFTFALARRLFPRRFVGELAIILLTFCTFWTEYVVGHWPHSISMLTVTAATYFFVEALDREKSASVPAFAAGAMIGLGMLFRLEGVLALPGIAALIIIYAKSPIKLLVSGMIGLAPFVVTAVWSNLTRFGSLNPLSYGSRGGGTDLTSYLPLGIFLGFVMFGLVILRHRGKAPSFSVWLLVGAAITAVGVALSPALSSMIAKTAEGFLSLVVDATRLSDPRNGVQSNPDGTMSFWGLPKKALGQSLPWLACLALLVGLRWEQHRRSIAIVLSICLVWAFPFLMRSWHGGLGLNMRYFLPLLPLLAALSSFLIVLLCDRFGYRLLILGVLFGLVFSALWQSNLIGGTAEFHQITTTRVFISIALVSLVSGFFPHRSTSGLALLAVGFGMGVALLVSFQDWSIAQERRSTMAAMSEKAKNLEGRFVIYGAPEATSYSARNSSHLLALPNRISDVIDTSFLTSACTNGYRALISTKILSSNPNLGLVAENTENEQAVDIPGYSEADCALINPVVFGEIPGSGS